MDIEKKSGDELFLYLIFLSVYVGAILTYKKILNFTKLVIQGKRADS